MARAVGALAALALLLAAPALSQTTSGFAYGVAAGDVTATTAMLWTRPDQLGPAIPELSTSPAFENTQLQTPAVVAPDRGGVATVAVTGLSPSTRYFYRFRGPAGVSEAGTFVTAPAPDAPGNLKLAFSGDADATIQNGATRHPLDVFDAISSERPDIFVFLGDTIYSDSTFAPRPAATLEEYRAKYLEARRSTSVRAALGASSVVAIWDDHEVENDFDSETVSQTKFTAGLRAFTEAWPIPGAGDGRLYRGLRWGREVEIFVLDTRSHRSRQVSKTTACHNSPGGGRSDPAPTLPQAQRAAYAPFIRQMASPVPQACLSALNDPSRTMLGAVQKQWLLQALQRSDATWKLIATSVPIQEFFALPYDRWEGYAAERTEILTFIRSAGIRNVVWLAADTHAILVNDVRLGTSGASTDVLGMKEVVAGPISANTFGAAIADLAGTLALPFFTAYLTAAPPQGLGMACAVLDRLTYAVIEIDARARRLTITPKDSNGRSVCRAPIVVVAQ
jgi:phosphodiesterase/alkaline phosphatase D-like protein